MAKKKIVQPKVEEVIKVVPKVSREDLLEANPRLKLPLR